MRSALQAGSLDDILASEENLADQLDSLPFLCRFQYEKAAAFMASYLDPAVERFKALAASPPASAGELEVVEAQLAWLVFLVGAIIKGRLSSSSAESQVRAGMSGVCVLGLCVHQSMSVRACRSSVAL